MACTFSGTSAGQWRGITCNIPGDIVKLDLSYRDLRGTIPTGLASLTAKRKQPVQCWDLHVGAKVNLLGKATTLNQCNGETLEWLEFHATQLKKLKERLDACLGKYQSRSLPAAIRFDKGHRRGRLDRDALSPGGTSLRSMLDQIQQLIGAVGHFRPSLAEKFAVQLEAITGLGMHPEEPHAGVLFSVER